MQVSWHSGVVHFVFGAGLPARGSEGRLRHIHGLGEAEALLRPGWSRPELRSSMMTVLAGAGGHATPLLDDRAALTELARMLASGRAWLREVPDFQGNAQPAGPDSPEPWDVDKAVAHALAKKEPHSLSRCAAYVNRALRAGGMVLEGKAPLSAKDYGPYLLLNGFFGIEPKLWQAEKGDICVIQKNPIGGVHGHVCLWTGEAWVSDFLQSGGAEGFYPGPEYRKQKPPYFFYRYRARS